ncbi:MAG: HD domain-containing phosphohydrolase [Pseudomonadota bacterium]
MPPNDQKPLRSSARPTVLVLDDQSTGRLVMAEVIKSIDHKINIMMFADALEAIDYVRREPPDLVLTDYRMPVIDGIETIRRLRCIYPYEQLPIVMTTVVDSREVLYRAFEAGATDYLVRPLDPTECRVRCKNLLSLRRQYLFNTSHADLVEERAEQVRTDLQLREMGILLRLAGAVDSPGAVSGKHLMRMGTYAGQIARGIGLSAEQVNTIELAAPLHDIGNAGIPDALLQKHGKLRAEEIAVMRDHVRIGPDLLRNSPSDFLQAATIIAQYHHEKFDGSGYPSGLQGHDIPLQARIVALADVFDALTSARPYRAPWESREAIAYIIGQKGLHFDPELVDVFVAQFGLTLSNQQVLSAGQRNAHGS